MTGPRISFEVEPDFKDKVSKIPWGLRSAIIRILLERVIESAEKHGQLVYGAVLDGKFTIEYQTEGDKK